MIDQPFAARYAHVCPELEKILVIDQTANSAS